MSFPDKSSVVSPLNGATNVSNEAVSLSWTTVATATGYDVYFGGTLQATQSATTYPITNLLYNEPYTWRIDTRNSTGITTGNVWNFTTKKPDLINGAMLFSSVPGPGLISYKSGSPFTVSISSPLSADNMIHLYSQYSRSHPYQILNSKWNHIIPQWRFEDTGGNIVNTINADTTTVYVCGYPVGSIGTAEFYYIDDMPTLEGSPVILWATLELSGLPDPDFEDIYVPSYANSRIIAAYPYCVNGQDPDHLEITRNGRDPIQYLKWTGVEFPYAITINGEGNLCNPDETGFPVLFDYPSANDVGLTYEIDRVITGIPLSGQVWNPLADYFQKYDSNGFHVGGFTIGSVTPSLSSDSSVISASVTVAYQPVFNEPSYVWVSNPENKTLNRLNYPLELTPSIISMLTSVPVSISPDAITDSKFTTPYITEINPTNTWSFSGFGGIFGIAVDECYNVWTSDAEMDFLYKFDSEGTLISSIDLTDTTNITGVSAGCTPAGIALDGDENIWVTLFDSASVLKFNKYGAYQYSITPGASIDVVGNIADMPTMIEPDSNNDIWIAYANSNNSYMSKYSATTATATKLFDVTLPLSSTPIDIVVDERDDSIWVTNANSFITGYGNVQHYSASGGLIATHTYENPNFITIDRYFGTWFGYGYNNVAYLPEGGSPITFSITGGAISNDINSDDYNDTTLGGIAGDSKGGVWIINSLENRMYRVSATSDFDSLTGNLQSFHILPDDVNYGWSTDGSSYATYTDPEHRSAQAYGDWTGYRWVRKYGDDFTTTGPITAIISGQSAEFVIKDFKNHNKIRKFNESWDAATQMQDYALAEHTKDNYNLFQAYFKGMLGGNASEDQHIGRLSYERIANFVANHGDIEDSNINQLYSISNKLGVPIDDYNFSYPVDIKRIMDLVSVGHQDLWGARCKCNKNFKRGISWCVNCSHIHCSNLGAQLDTSTYVLTAGEKFVIKAIFGEGNYEVLEPVVSQPLSATASISWLTSANYAQYNFYDYIDVTCDEQVEGVISWDDDYTTLMETNSSIVDWYEENGIVEEMLNFFLHKGLELDG